MARKRLMRSDSRLLLDILLKRSTAWSDLCEMAWDNDTQSEAGALVLRDEIDLVLRAYLEGNYAPINQKLEQHSRRPPLMAVRAVGEEKQLYSGNFYPLVKTIRAGDKDASLVTMHSSEATAEEVVYGVVRRALDSGDIKHLALCRTCKSFFYRDRNKGKSCGSTCRWRYFNNADTRADEAHDRYAKRVRSEPGKQNVRVARRPRNKTKGGNPG